MPYESSIFTVSQNKREFPNSTKSDFSFGRGFFDFGSAKKEKVTKDVDFGIKAKDERHNSLNSRGKQREDDFYSGAKYNSNEPKSRLKISTKQENRVSTNYSSIFHKSENPSKTYSSHFSQAKLNMGNNHNAESTDNNDCWSKTMADRCNRVSMRSSVNKNNNQFSNNTISKGNSSTLKYSDFVFSNGSNDHSTKEIQNSNKNDNKATPDSRYEKGTKEENVRRQENKDSNDFIKQERQIVSFLKENIPSKTTKLTESLHQRREEASKKLKEKISNLGNPEINGGGSGYREEVEEGDYLNISAKINSLEGKLQNLKNTIRDKKEKRSLSSSKESKTLEIQTKSQSQTKPRSNRKSHDQYATIRNPELHHYDTSEKFPSKMYKTDVNNIPENNNKSEAALKNQKAQENWEIESELMSSRLRNAWAAKTSTLKDVSNTNTNVTKINEKTEMTKKWFFESYTRKEKETTNSNFQSKMSNWAYLDPENTPTNEQPVKVNLRGQTKERAESRSKPNQEPSKKTNIHSYITQVPENQTLQSSHVRSRMPVQGNLKYYTTKCLFALKCLENKESNDYTSGLYIDHLQQSHHALKSITNSIKLDQFKRITLSQKNSGRKTIVFDLDETLIHCIDSGNPDFTVPVLLPNSSETITAKIKVRPHLMEALEKLSKEFELIVFTASHSCYADPVINEIDPNRSFFSHRLYREHCIMVQDVYIKEIRLINRRLEDMVLVDNATYSFGENIENGIPIIPFYDYEEDSELLDLTSFLMSLKGVKDVRDEIRNEFQFRKLQEMKSLQFNEIKALWGK